MNVDTSLLQRTTKGSLIIGADALLASQAIFLGGDNLTKNWESRFKVQNLFDHLLFNFIHNKKFTSFLFKQGFRKALSELTTINSHSLAVQITLHFNNFINSLFYGIEDHIITTERLQACIKLSNSDVSFSDPEGAVEAFSILSCSIAEVYPSFGKKWHKQDSAHFKKKLNLISYQISVLKSRFYVEEITRVFSLSRPPASLLLVLRALIYLLTGEDIDWNYRNFNMKELCDFLLRLTPNCISPKQRNFIVSKYFLDLFWDLDKINRQSKIGSDMAQWLIYLVEASQIYNNLKYQAKYFEISENVNYSYFRWPRNFTFGILLAEDVDKLKLNAEDYPASVKEYLTKSIPFTESQGFLLEFCKPENLVVFSSKFRFNF